jgi:hypothetical protein
MGGHYLKPTLDCDDASTWLRLLRIRCDIHGRFRAAGYLGSTESVIRPISVPWVRISLPAAYLKTYNEQWLDECERWSGKIVKALYEHGQGRPEQKRQKIRQDIQYQGLDIQLSVYRSTWNRTLNHYATYKVKSSKYQTRQWTAWWGSQYLVLTKFAAFQCFTKNGRAHSMRNMKPFSVSRQ